MAEIARCPNCDEALPADAPRGLCPVCLLRPFLGDDPGAPRDRSRDAGDLGSWESWPAKKMRAAGGLADAGARVDPLDEEAKPIVPPVHVEICRAGPSTEMEGTMIGP